MTRWPTRSYTVLENIKFLMGITLTPPNPPTHQKLPVVYCAVGVTFQNLPGNIKINYFHVLQTEAKKKINKE